MYKGHQHPEHETEACACSHEHHEDCGCGHEHHEEHHHQHHEGCGCGHEHHQEHHHQHHEGCGCGHEHHQEHQHQHHEGCGCGHEHHQEHQHEIREHREICTQCGNTMDSCTCTTTATGEQKKIYLLENLGCANCAAKMEDQINKLEGITSATITFATRQLRVTAQNPDQYLEEIRKICTSIESQVRVTDRSAAPSQSTAAQDDKGNPSFLQLHKEGITLAAGACFFLTGILLEKVGFDGLPSVLVLLAAYFILGGQILLEAGKNMLHGQIFDENFLMSIATLGALLIKNYPEAVGVMLFYRVGEMFEHRAVEKSRSQIMDAIDMRPEVVNLKTAQGTKTIPAENAKIGDSVLIRPGDRIPLDGVIIEGDSRVDTSPITGEPVPVSVKAGDQITSGCVNLSGQLTMRVEKALEDSMVTRILDSVENAAASKPKIDRFITRFSRIYTPVVVLIALATAILPSLVTGEWHYWIYTALTFLVMSCPCALVLSVPLAFFSGIGAGSKKGILFKGGVSIEALSKIKTVIMDKTGTITQGNFQVQKILPEETHTSQELLRICASCEQNSTHPIAHSIVTAAKEAGLDFLTPVSLEELAGHGISAVLNGDKVLCGNKKLMEKYRIPLPQESKKNYGTQVYIAVNNHFVGSLIISDTIKADAASAITKLKSLGLKTVMLTGDSEESAHSVAQQTGIEQVYAKLLPQDKLEILQKIRSEHGSTMFIGDGINDAPVLAGADVGAAMGSGADAAIEAADTVFMNSSVESIPLSVSIARKTGRIAVQNVVFALVIKIAVMLLGLFGYANMWMAVFADTGVAMLCILNSIRILYQHR